jgi:hypothetical protein
VTVALLTGTIKTLPVLETKVLVILKLQKITVSLIIDKQIKALVFKLLKEGKVYPRSAVAGVFIITPSYILHSRACVRAVHHILTG